MVVRPLRDAEIVAGHGIAHGRRSPRRARAAIAEMLGILDLAVGVGQQHGGFAFDAREHVADEELRKLVDGAPARELAAERVELGRAALALARDRSLALAERGEMADQQRRRQHDART